MSAVKRAQAIFAFGASKRVGWNSSGRIASFHRGDGAKRLQRTLDLKRNAASSMGVVERIEYNPNCSSRITLVRWVHGIQPRHPPHCRLAADDSAAPPPCKALEVEPATNIRAVFLFNSMLPLVGTAARDVFFSAFLSKAKGGAEAAFASASVSESESLSLNLPRIVVAAVKPAFFAPRVNGEETLQVRN